VHRTRKVCGLSIHAAIQAPPNLSPDATSLHLGHCGGGTESPQKINQYIATLPYEQPFATSLAPMSAKLIEFCQSRKMRRFRGGDVDLKVHTP
jgi:hypothetical protein